MAARAAQPTAAPSPEDIREAHRLMESNQAGGKIVVAL
jgi:hypothetical protein